ncbi:MAG: signal peptidase II [Candidatus Latescibacterota bacterium]|nr:MAG: signal peptidase II [Candidatus Latescibacterota bacterium]
MGFLLPALIVVILDQVSKQFLWGLGNNFDLIDGFLRITLVRNSGAAFGMLQGGRVFLIISSVVASIFIIILAQRIPKEELLKRVFLGMILGGAIGNLIDRIYPGHVIDFIDMGIGVHRWPVYNLADTAVTVGGILLIITYSLKREPNQL